MEAKIPIDSILGSGRPYIPFIRFVPFHILEVSIADMSDLTAAAIQRYSIIPNELLQ